MNARKGDWIISSKGRRLFPLDLQPEEIDLEEIAHALSNICRFGGHCREFYSVAQHSVLVSDLCPDYLKRTGLLHDAAESYCGDVVRPLKQNLPGFAAIEDNLWSAIAAAFDLPTVIPEAVQIEDARVLLMEKRDLLCHHEHRWEFPQCAFPDLSVPERPIVPLGPKESYALFMGRAEALSLRPRTSIL